jgi:hypothetical protein
MLLYSITADTVNISSPALSLVADIETKNLTVDADDDDKLSVPKAIVGESIAINGGTYGNFGFIGSTASTITAGKFTGEFDFGGSGELTITGGFFTGEQNLLSG